MDSSEPTPDTRDRDTLEGTYKKLPTDARDRDTLEGTYNKLPNVDKSPQEARGNMYDVLTTISGYPVHSKALEHSEHFVPSEELERLSDLERELGDDQNNVRRSINETYRPQTRSLHILDMPQEILVRTFELVEGFRPDLPGVWFAACRDIQRIRLTCRRFCHASSHLLLRSVSMDLQRSSLIRLLEIARHPRISKGVRSVRVILHFYSSFLIEDVFEFLSFNIEKVENMVGMEKAMEMGRFANTSEEDDFDEAGKADAILASWRRILPAPLHQYLPGTPDETFGGQEDNVHRTLLMRAHREYQRLYRDQELLRRRGGLSHIVGTAMARMPFAQRLELLGVDHFSDRLQLRGCGDVCRSIYEATLEPTPWDEAVEAGFGQQLHWVMMELPGGIRTAGGWLESIQISLPILEDPPDLVPSPEAQQQLSSAAQRLKSFSFECDFMASGGFMAQRLEDNLHTFLIACLDTPTLEALSLTRPEGGAEDSVVFSVGPVITAYYLRRI